MMPSAASRSGLQSRTNVPVKISIEPFESSHVFSLLISFFTALFMRFLRPGVRR
jgi:hypothetical protein